MSLKLVSALERNITFSRNYQSFIIQNIDWREKNHTKHYNCQDLASSECVRCKVSHSTDKSTCNSRRDENVVNLPLSSWPISVVYCLQEQEGCKRSHHSSEQWIIQFKHIS